MARSLWCSMVWYSKQCQCEWKRCENGATDSIDVVVTKMVSNLTITVVITNTDRGLNQQDVSKQEQWYKALRPRRCNVRHASVAGVQRPKWNGSEDLSNADWIPPFRVLTARLVAMERMMEVLPQSFLAAVEFARHKESVQKDEAKHRFIHNEHR